MIFNIFLPPKKGHYEDYSIFLKNILENHEVKVVRDFNGKIKAFFKFDQNIIFLNIDDREIYWSILRSIFTNKNYGVTVSLEVLVSNRLNGSSYLSSIKKDLKYELFKILKSTKRLKLISIHKMTSYEDKLKKIVSFLTYDFQYYDLPYLNINYEQPEELKSLKFKNSNETVLIFNNTSREKKNLSELKAWIRSSKKFNFYIVGDNSFLDMCNTDNVITINRYVSNEEMLYFITNSSIIYCYYNNNRPSGFMGRAMQLRKKIIVPAQSYLGSIPYNNSIRISDLQEMENVNWNSVEAGYAANSYSNFDESNLLRTFLTNGEL